MQSTSIALQSLPYLLGVGWRSGFSHGREIFGTDPGPEFLHPNLPHWVTEGDLIIPKIWIRFI